MSTAAQQHLKMVIKMQRRRMSKGQRKRKRVRRVKYIYPWAVERQYAAQLKAWLKPLTKAVDSYLAQHHEAILRGDSFHADAVTGKGFHLLISTMRGWVLQHLGNADNKTSTLLMGLGRYAGLTKWNADKEFSKQMVSIIGQDFTTSQIWWDAMLKEWQRSNFDRIQTIANRYIDTVNITVEKAVTNGYSWKTLSQQIAEKNEDLETWQCDRLARDQIGKLNGNIAQAQNKEAGIECYTWQTAGDDRVRDETNSPDDQHDALDGMLCRWDDATVYSDDDGKTWQERPDDWCQEHPGIDIQCRCCAIPYMDDIIKDVDNEIDEEAT